MVETFLLNFLSVLVCFFIFQLWMNSKLPHSKHGRWETGLMSGLCIILCISFPVSMAEGFIFDLRDIPIWLGSLYGGPVVAIGLYIVTVGYRAFFGGDGVVATAIVTLIFVVIAIWLHPWYIRKSSFKKTVAAVILVLLSSVVSLLIVRMMGEELNLEVSAVYILAQTVGMFILMLAAETMRGHIKNQRYLKKAEKWETSSQLSASLSHEIRNKMNTTKGFLQLLREMEGDETKYRYVNIALMELEGAEKILQSYLSYSKPSDEKVRIFNINKEVYSMGSVLMPLAENYGVEMKIHMDAEGFVRGEPSLFRQALLNLMKNGIEAMPNGGTLDVRVETDGESTLNLEIKDTGVGMTREQISRIGEPYFSTKGDEGTGLGMVVVYQTIKNMNGELTIQSEPLIGTCFHIRLPLTKPENFYNKV